MRIELRPRKSAEKFQPYLDTFLLSGCSKPLGGVLVLPGGGYSGRAAHEGDPVAQTFNALGYHAFVLQYRTSIDGGAYPDPQQDLIRAIRIIRAHAEQWRLDKIAVLGFSQAVILPLPARCLPVRSMPMKMMNMTVFPVRQMR